MTPASLQEWQPGWSPETLSAALFRGDLVVFRGFEPVERLVRHARRILRRCFDSRDPETAEASLPPPEFRRRAVLARRAVAADGDLESAWRDCLIRTGYPDDEIYRDRVRLRVVPSAPAACGRAIAPLAPHRDTWGSGVMAQVNWWMPLFSLAPTRTMLVWPDAFESPVANTSEQWDHAAVLDDADKRYPLLPTAEDVPPDGARPVLIRPGELLAFSAAHLHASAGDDSGRSRLSMDTRTVWTGDLSAGRAAANVDGRGRTVHWDWFTRAGRPLAPAAAATGDRPC